MERQNTPVATDQLPEDGLGHERTPDEAQVEQLVAWYFRSTPGSALQRRRAVAERLLGRLRIARKAA
jgi:hypothetical protein